jgi:DNA-directed RNA polymerase subunit M/transcription elongation factor TFIIS
MSWIDAQIKRDLKSMTSMQVAEKLAADRYGFNDATFDKLRKRQSEQDDYVANPFQVEEGVMECGRCGGKRVYSVSVQTRAADEPMSTRAFCVTCKHRWTQNC